MGFWTGMVVGACGGLISGWFLLPTPARIQKFWQDRGWVDRVR